MDYLPDLGRSIRYPKRIRPPRVLMLVLARSRYDNATIAAA